MLSKDEKDLALGILADASTNLDDALCLVLGWMGSDGNIVIQGAGKVGPGLAVAYLLLEENKRKALGESMDYNYRDDHEVE